MLPALTGTNRMADHDVKLGGYVIPRNTMIWCNLNAMFSSPDIWDEPEKYRPVRSFEPEVCHYVCQSQEGCGLAQCKATHQGSSSRQRCRRSLCQGSGLLRAQSWLPAGAVGEFWRGVSAERGCHGGCTWHQRAHQGCSRGNCGLSRL